MGSAFYQLGRSIARGLFSASCRISILGNKDHLNDQCILVANHISHFDPVLISAVCRRQIDWMAMEDLFVHPWMAWFFRGFDAFPVKRFQADRRALRVALERLKQKRLVGVFPEGGIRAGATSILEGAPMRGGAALLSVISGAPLLPCVILGSDRLYNPRQWIPLRKTPIWVTFGELIYPIPGGARDIGRLQCEKLLAEAFPVLQAKMVREFGLSKEDLPKTPKERRGSALAEGPIYASTTADNPVGKGKGINNESDY